MATGTVADWVTNLTDYGLGDDIDPGDLLDIFNKVIQDVNTRTAWSFLEATTTVTLTAGTNTVTLPSRFNKSRTFIIDSVPQIIVPERRETILKKYAGNLTQVGCPFNYYFIGQSMFVYPTPDANYTAILDYFQDEAVVTLATNLSSLLLPLKHQDVYLLGIIQRLYAIEDDTELYTLFGNRFEKKIVDMMDDLEMHQFDMPDYIVDTYDDGYGF